MKKSIFCLTATLIISSLALAGCKTNDSTAQSNTSSVESSVSDEQVKYPIVIKHAFGETSIESKPQRIAAIGSRNEDSLLSLGVIPVGISINTYGVTDDSGLLPWANEALKKLDKNTKIYNDIDGLDFEAISESKPDLILATYSGITKEDYDLLSEIAPVVAYPDQPWMTDWRSQTLTNATAIGMEKEGQELVKTLEETIQNEVNKYPEIKGKNAAFFSFDATDLSNFWLYMPGDSRVDYLADYGFEMPESIKKLAAENKDFAIQVSAENVEMFKDIDVMVMYGDDSVLQAIKNDKLLGTIPAVQRGSVVMIEDNSPLAASCNPSALAIPAHVSDLAKLYGEAASKVK